jgi:dolichol-phosphate mannosyltransferase
MDDERTVPPGRQRLGEGTSIIIPTYNEIENLPLLLKRVFEELPGAQVIVVDDNSPDGTGAFADGAASADSRIHVLHRQGKLGLGTAYITGFRAALSTTASYIFEMDADFSHDPAYLPQFLDHITHADVVIGSRYVSGGGVLKWGFHRKVISGMGNSFARALLRLPARDCTAGYKCYRREVLERIDLDAIHSEGYAFQVEMIYRSNRKGFRIREFPIIFPDRTRGKSKMHYDIIIEALRFVVRAKMGRVQ